MARFIYHARDGRGEAMTGMVSAITLDEATQILRGEGKFVVRLNRVNDADFQADPIAVETRARRVKRESVIQFAHQMAVMLETGVPISEALESLTEQASDMNFKPVLADVCEHVRAGGELSAAMRKYPTVFPTAMTSLVRASELSGTMSTMLDRIAIYLTKEHQTARRVRGALAYPMFMLLVAIGVTVFLLAFVLPRFATIYASRGAALPGPTRLLIGMSNLVVDYWPVWLAAIVLATGGWMVMIGHPIGQRVVASLKLNTPVLRTLFRALYLGRITRTMGVMLSAGVSVLDTIPIAKQVVNNPFYDDLFDEVDERLRQGAQLSEPFFATPLIPRSVAQMIRSGEKSGRLSQVLLRIADFAEEELDEAIKTTTQFIEPVIIVFMGTLVGFVAISLLLPIFNVSKVMAG